MFANTEVKNGGLHTFPKKQWFQIVVKHRKSRYSSLAKLARTHTYWPFVGKNSPEIHPFGWGKVRIRSVCLFVEIKDSSCGYARVSSQCLKRRHNVIPMRKKLMKLTHLEEQNIIFWSCKWSNVNANWANISLISTGKHSNHEFWLWKWKLAVWEKLHPKLVACPQDMAGHSNIKCLEMLWIGKDKDRAVVH